MYKYFHYIKLNIMKAIIIFLFGILLIMPVICIEMSTITEKISEKQYCNFTYAELDLFMMSDNTETVYFESDIVRAINLSENAHKMSYVIGCAIIWNEQTFKDGQYDVYNYVVIKDDLIFIDASDDTRLSLDDFITVGKDRYRYIKFYPDGTKLPLNPIKNIKYDIDLYDLHKYI